MKKKPYWWVVVVVFVSQGSCDEFVFSRVGKEKQLAVGNGKLG